MGEMFVSWRLCSDTGYRIVSCRISKFIKRRLQYSDHSEAQPWQCEDPRVETGF